MTSFKKVIIIFFIVIFIFSVIISIPIYKASTKISSFIVVIDAGHGGIDGGAVGINTGIDENTINLKYAKFLKKLYKEYGFEVVMTREDLNGLYDITSSNKKIDDMGKRKKIIESSGANFVISIHMNSYIPSCRGAQTFYTYNDKSSEALAVSIQNMLKKNLEFARINPQIGDYYILNCSNIPSVIVECGFLSNPHDERLLITDEYMEKLCNNVFVGSLLYLAS